MDETIEELEARLKALRKVVNAEKRRLARAERKRRLDAFKPGSYLVIRYNPSNMAIAKIGHCHQFETYLGLYDIVEPIKQAFRADWIKAHKDKLL